MGDKLSYSFLSIYIYETVCADIIVYEILNKCRCNNMPCKSQCKTYTYVEMHQLIILIIVIKQNVLRACASYEALIVLTSEAPHTYI